MESKKLRLFYIIVIFILSLVYILTPLNVEADGDSTEINYPSSCFPVPYKTIALKSDTNGCYLTCDIGSKKDGKYEKFNNSEIKVEATQVQAYEMFDLVPCGDGLFAIRSIMNRKYLSDNIWGLKFQADFIKADEFVELSHIGSRTFIRFTGTNKYIRLNGNKVETTDHYSEAEGFIMETVSLNSYSKEEKTILSSREWFDLNDSNNKKDGGYWNIQNEIGKDKISSDSHENTKTLTNLGYYTMYRYDKITRKTIEYDNMQCAIGVKPLDDGKYDLIITFQGTGGYHDDCDDNETQDILANAASLGSADEHGMHVGYYEMAKKLVDNENHVQVIIDDQLYKLSDFISMAKTGNAHITILGHSMGGAIAQCYAIHLNNLGVPKSSVSGRTFNPALALNYDINWPDWYNLCVSSDSVPNGLVKASLVEYGIHRLGKTIWIYDPKPDVNLSDVGLDDNSDFFKYIGNIAADKHNMDQTIKRQLESIYNKCQRYRNNTSDGYDISADDILDYYEVNGDVTLDHDLEVYGCVRVKTGTLNINGYNLIVHGDMFIGNGTINNDGLIDVKRDLHQKKGIINIFENGSLNIDGSFYQLDKISVNSGVLSIGEDWVVGDEQRTYNNSSDYFSWCSRIGVTNDSDIYIGNDFIAYDLYSTSDYNLTSGSMTVGGNIIVSMSTDRYSFLLRGKESFTIKMLGDQPVKVKNVEGVNLEIENADERELVFSNTVSVASLTGGKMIIKPENLSFGAPMSEDITINGDVTIYSWVSLNGHDLKVNGKVTILDRQDEVGIGISGKMTAKQIIQNISGWEPDNGIYVYEDGVLSVESSYYQKNGTFRCVGGDIKIGEDWIAGDESINISDSSCRPRISFTENSEISVKNDFIGYGLLGTSTSQKPYNNFRSGNMIVGGNVVVSKGDPLSGQAGFTIKMLGDKPLKVQNIKGVNLEIENADERELVFSDIVSVASLTGGKMVINPESLRFGTPMSEDITINGDVTIYSWVSLNGHDLKVNGKVTISDNQDEAGIGVSGKMTAKQIIQNVSGWKPDNGICVYEDGILSVETSYYQKSGTFKCTGGDTIIGEDWIAGEESINLSDSSYRPRISITENSEISVKNDFIGYGLLGTSTSQKPYNNFRSGNMIVGGNVVVSKGDPLSGQAGFTIKMLGDKPLKVQNIEGVNIEIENADSRQIQFIELINPYKYVCSNMVVDTLNAKIGGILTNNIIFNGSVELNKDVDVNRNSLYIKGDLIQSGGSLNICGGLVDISDNYYIANKVNDDFEVANGASLYMLDKSDKLIVGKNMYVYSDKQSSLENGELYIKGNFTQKGEYKNNNFYASGNHVTVLNGESLQTISFDTYPNSKFNQIKLTQNEDNYVFYPEECRTDIINNSTHVHELIEYKAVDAKCEKPGNMLYYQCSTCNKYFTDAEGINEIEVNSWIIPAIGHKWDEGVVTKLATATDDGIKTYTCSRCNETKTEVIPATGEQPKETPTVPPTEKPINYSTPSPMAIPSSNPTDQSTNPTEMPANPVEQPVNPTEQPDVDKSHTEDGIGIISSDGKVLTDEDGIKYLVAEKVTFDQLNKNVSIADKKSGKYKITKVIKKKGKITGGEVFYVKPYNRNCKTASVKATVKIAGVTFKVTAVADNAFKGCLKVTKISIGKNVTKIGKNAFNGCSSLKNVNVKAENLKKIGSKAFKGIHPKAKFKLYKKKYSKYKKMIKKSKAPKTSKYSK